MFDNSRNHGVCVKDALVAQRMNWNSGGKQPMIRDGWMRGGENDTIPQVMYEEIKEDGNKKQIPREACCGMSREWSAGTSGRMRMGSST